MQLYDVLKILKLLKMSFLKHMLKQLKSQRKITKYIIQSPGYSAMFKIDDILITKFYLLKRTVDHSHKLAEVNECNTVNFSRKYIGGIDRNKSKSARNAAVQLQFCSNTYVLYNVNKRAYMKICTYMNIINYYINTTYIICERILFNNILLYNCLLYTSRCV